ncbi:hypothetical protein L579_3621 [Pantoea sp. AS-PWVM4]|uniref:hypothetical protein n=1 Tax=Pantoea sp. AS-PWVM4 TaxID=1332069 RepID=UPI0003AC5C9F|nr:hypothetical protein [Pantoea sp. AS-PWVM4]ERK17740.1 hypothetical protein L579_3621 [Pantoea sp. AS-PWVM4]
MINHAATNRVPGVSTRDKSRRYQPCSGRINARQIPSDNPLPNGSGAIYRATLCAIIGLPAAAAEKSFSRCIAQQQACA